MSRIKIFVVISLFAFKLQVLIAQSSTYDFKRVDDFGYALDSALQKLDTAYFDSLFDNKIFVSRVVDKSAILSKQENRTVITYDFNNSFSYGRIIKKLIEKGAIYNYIKFYIDNNKKFHLLFRLYDEENGINYHDYLLEKHNDSYRVVDVFIFLSGEYLSDTFRSIYKNYFEAKNSIFNSRYSKSFSKIVKMRQFCNNQQYKEAYDLYNTIPVKYAQEKPFLLLYIDLASKLDNKLYVEAISKYEELYPNDPVLSLVLMDKNFINKNYIEALKNINDLDVFLKGDSFLDLYRGNIYFGMEDYENAKKYLINITENYPYFYEGYDSLLSLYIYLKEYMNALKVLENFINYFNSDKESVAETIKEHYPDFYKTESFKNWLKPK